MTVAATAVFEVFHLQAIRCGTFSSQQNWTFDPYAEKIRWGMFCLMTCYGMPMDQCEHPVDEELFLGRCDLGENQRFWQEGDGRELHTMHNPDKWSPFAHEHCVEVSAEHGPRIRTSYCKKVDKLWDYLDMDWARRSLHINAHRIWYFDDGEMRDGNGHCVDVWRDGKSVGTQLRTLEAAFSPKMYWLMLLKRLAFALSGLVAFFSTMCFCCRLVKRAKARRQLPPERSADESSLLAEWQTLEEFVDGA